MNPGPEPIVRHFIACKDFTGLPNGSDFSLVQVTHVLQFAPGATFLLADKLCLFVVLTDCRGNQTFGIDFVAVGDSLQQRLIATGLRFTVDFRDPLEVCCVPIVLRDIIFAKRRQYEFQLL
jgi:hypothetical protein